MKGHTVTEVFKAKGRWIQSIVNKQLVNKKIMTNRSSRRRDEFYV